MQFLRSLYRPLPSACSAPVADWRLPRWLHPGVIAPAHRVMFRPGPELVCATRCPYTITAQGHDNVPLVPAEGGGAPLMASRRTHTVIPRPPGCMARAGCPQSWIQRDSSLVDSWSGHGNRLPRIYSQETIGSPPDPLRGGGPSVLPPSEHDHHTSLHLWLHATGLAGNNHLRSTPVTDIDRGNTWRRKSSAP